MPDHHKPDRNMFCLTWLVDSDPPKTQESPQRSTQNDLPQHTLPPADWWALRRKISWNFAKGTRGEGQTVIAKGRMGLPVNGSTLLLELLWQRKAYFTWQCLGTVNLMEWLTAREYTPHIWKDLATFSKNLQYIFVGP